jgi:hypothetical protein
MMAMLSPRVVLIVDTDPTLVSQDVSVEARSEKSTPFSRGPLYGLLYCLAGIGVGFGAHAVGGWVSFPIWLLAVLLFVAGLWTALFMGAWLLLLRKARRSSGERR